MDARSDGVRAECLTLALGLGIVVFVLGAVGIVVDIVPGAPVSGLGLQRDLDLEVLGAILSVGAILGSRTRTETPAIDEEAILNRVEGSVYITRPLLETLLRRAQRSEPNQLSIGLGVTPAEELAGGDHLPQGVPVFTHLYFPERSNSVSFVFGVDLQTPPGRTQGRFVAHPLSDCQLTKRDDLHEVVFVAVPPWDEASVSVFDRRGLRHPLEIVDAVPPEEPLPSRDQ